MGPAGTVTAIAVAFALAIGLAPVLYRFFVEDASNDLCFVGLAATMGGMGILFSVCTGGASPDNIIAFQPVEKLFCHPNTD